MIDTVIFDIGNVLAYFSWKESIRSLYGDGELYNRVADATVGNTKKWIEMDRGVMSYEEVLESFYCDVPDIKDEICAAVSKFYDDIAPYDYSEQWVLTLKNKGYKVYLLSNYGKVPYELSLPKFTFTQHVDGAVISYEAKLIKPDPNIYKFICNKYGIDPKRAVFLDDMPENVAAAEEYGFRGIVFTDKASADGQLKEMGVNA